MTINKIEELMVWEKSKELTLVVYNTFASLKDYSFKDQIQRASVSIMNNVAEGFEHKGNKEFSRFLYISKGSCGEVRSMLYLALELKYISEKEFGIIYESSVEISKMLAGLIRTLK